jgi:hypothetical protein
MIPAEIAHFALDSAFLVAPRRIAKLRLKAPVRAESDQAFRLLPLMAAQNLLHRALQVVVAQAPEHPAEIAERQLVRFQKSLLRGVIVGHVKRSPINLILSQKPEYVLPGTADLTAVVIPNQPDRPFLPILDDNATLSVDIGLPEAGTLEGLLPLQVIQ